MNKNSLINLILKFYLFLFFLSFNFYFPDFIFASNYPENKTISNSSNKNYIDILDSGETSLFEKFNKNFFNYYKPEIKAGTGNVIAAVRSIKTNKIIFTNDYNSYLNKKIAPGSILKIVCSAFLLENPDFSENSSIFCNDLIKLGGKKFNCSYKGGHGNLIFEQAFTHSCNIYFQETMKKFPREQFLDFLKKLGFINQSEKNKLLKSGDEFYYQAIIGDYLIKTTPEELMNFVEFIALCGHKNQSPNASVNLSNKTFQKLNSLLRLVTLSGTASKSLSNYDIAGKTGSSLKYITIHNRKKTTYTSGVFCGYLPYINPKYVIFAYCENGMGGNEAAELIKAVIADL